MKRRIANENRSARTQYLVLSTQYRDVQAALTLFLVVLYSCFAAPGRSADWPQWRGPEGTGVSSDQAVPIIWHEQRSIVWKCPLPPWGASTPAIWGDAIFVTSHTAENKLLLLKIDRQDGRIVWTQEIGSGEAARQAPKRTTQKFHELHNLASPSP